MNANPTDGKVNDVLQEMAASLRRIEQLLSQPRMERQFYSTSEAARLTGLSAWMIRQHCNVGNIPGAKKEGNSLRWLVPVAALPLIAERRLPPL